MKRALALTIILFARAAAAETPSVDVQDLPPLPPEQEEQSSSATLLAASQVEEDVVVGAAKREQSLGNVASAVTVVSGDRLRRFGYRTVGEAIAGVAGVYISDNRISYSAGIRGLQIPGDFNTRILVLVDGASVNEGWGAFAGLSFDNFVSIDDVARIEVIRGPVSSLYGSNAFFGIVNIVTRSAAETPRAWAKASINSIWGETTSAGFATGDVHQQLRGTFQLMNRIGDTTTLPDVGTDLKGDGGHQYMISLVGSYQGSFAQVRAVQYRRDSPFAPYNGDPMLSNPYNQYDSQLLVEGGHTRELSKRFTIAGRGYANIYRFSDHINQLGGVPFDDVGDAKTFGAELRGRYELVVPNKVGLTTGAEANYNITKSHSFAGDGSTDATVPLNFSIQGVYSELDGQPTEWLGFTAGLRYDNNTKLDQRVSPRAALFLSKHEKYGLKLLYAEGFRNPSAFEGFFTDQISFAANPDIHSERIRSFETVAWAKPIAGLSTRLSGFYWDARDIVEQLPYTDPTTMMDLLQFQNADRFVTRGVEVEASYRTNQGWYGFGGASAQQVGAQSSGSALEFGDVPNAPKVTGAIGVSTPKLGGYAHVSTEAIYIGKRPTRHDVDDPTITNAPSPAWLGWNANVYVPDLRGFDVTAGVRNIIGTRDRVVAPGDYDRYDSTTMATTTIPTVPGEGREVYVKVGYRY